MGKGVREIVLIQVIVDTISKLLLPVFSGRRISNEEVFVDMFVLDGKDGKNEDDVAGGYRDARHSTPSLLNQCLDPFATTFTCFFPKICSQ